MTDSYDRALAALLREEKEANQRLKDRIKELLDEQDRLLAEVARLDEVILDKERAETEKLGTFPAVPRSVLGVVNGRG